MEARERKLAQLAAEDAAAAAAQEAATNTAATPEADMAQVTAAATGVLPLVSALLTLACSHHPACSWAQVHAAVLLSRVYLNGRA